MKNLQYSCPFKLDRVKIRFYSPYLRCCAVCSAVAIWKLAACFVVARRNFSRRVREKNPTRFSWSRFQTLAAASPGPEPEISGLMKTSRKDTFDWQVLLSEKSRKTSLKIAKKTEEEKKIILYKKNSKKVPFFLHKTATSKRSVFEENLLLKLC